MLTLGRVCQGEDPCLGCGEGWKGKIKGKIPEGENSKRGQIWGTVTPPSSRTISCRKRRTEIVIRCASVSTFGLDVIIIIKQTKRLCKALI